jgi:hypothetical protein
MDSKKNQINFDLDNLPEDLSFEALSKKYAMNLDNEANIIGSGTFGNVHELIKKDDGSVFAGKYMSVSNKQDF